MSFFITEIISPGCRALCGAIYEKKKEINKKGKDDRFKLFATIFSRYLAISY